MIVGHIADARRAAWNVLCLLHFDFVTFLFSVCVLVTAFSGGT